MENLFVLTGVIIGMSVINKPSKSSILLLTLNNAMGLFTIPTFLFPACGLYLWVAESLLLKNYCFIHLGENYVFPFAIFLTILTFIFYTPVIIFPNGIERIVSNSTVQQLPWNRFLQSS